MELISGFARLAVLRETNQEVLVRLVEADSVADCGLLYLADNGHRVIDDGMKLAALRFFKAHMDDHSNVLPQLGIKPKSKDAKLFSTWIDLPEIWHAHLSEGRIPLAAGATLCNLTADDLSTLEPLFARFSWSRSNAVNLLTWLFETGKMTSAPVSEVMEHAGFEAILSQGLSPKDTIARLTQAAREVRYPTLSDLNAAFTATARDLTTGTRWRLVQPNNFETGGAELTIQVANRDQLTRAASDLDSMAEQDGWDSLFKLGRKDD